MTASANILCFHICACTQMFCSCMFLSCVCHYLAMEKCFCLLNNLYTMNIVPSVSEEDVHTGQEPRTFEARHCQVIEFPK